MAKIKNNDSKRIKDLIKKVRVLAERGEKNERDVAKVKLAELMEKYQLTKFEESKSKKRSFKLIDFCDCKTIMVHCILDTNATTTIDGSLQKKELYCNLTDEEYVNVCEKFNHYYPEFVNQREAFMKAFILTNDLGIVDGECETQEEDINNIKNMMQNVRATNYKSNKLLQE